MRGGLFLLSSLAIIMILFSAVIWSIFAKDFDISGDALQLSSIVAPIPVAENKPQPEPAPAPKQQTKSEQPKIQKDLVIKRQTNTLRIDESPTKAPENVSVTNNKTKARPNSAFVIDKGEETDVQGTISDNLKRGDGSQNGEGLKPSNNIKPVEPEKVEPKKPEKPPVAVKEPPKEVAKPKPLPISGGVVNGKAISLPPPPYPASARTAGARGDVSVQVTIDENGNVISATAVSGHVLLRNAAANAARNAKFRPTLLSDQPVKVKGIIIYRFAG